jgi:hypothetical protein
VPRSVVGAWGRDVTGAVEDLKSSVRKDVQVRILPPLPWIFREPAAIDRAVDVAGRAYSFLLGMYLGDGHVVAAKKSYRLQIYLNTAYPDRIDRVADAGKTLLPNRSVALVRHSKNAIAVSTYFVGWPWLFPQHGPGPKHARRIVLAPWQNEVVAWYPEEFMRGCIESDGCRHRRIVNGKNYPAYSFCNKSEDILGLFTAVCDMLGVRWRRANAMIISIARRPDVARLDAMLGYRDTSAPRD